MRDHSPTSLADPLRLAAITLSGLGPEPDESFDRFAELSRSTIGVPVALVSLVDDVRQFFPGQVGLGRPWCDTRQTPLSHSFCQLVAMSGEPLVVTDSRHDPRVTGNHAITDLGVVAYAGMPLTDQDGAVVGALAVIDQEPRVWTASELTTLKTLAAACSSEIQLRIAATRTASLLNERNDLTDQLQTALGSAELLLTSSEHLGSATTLHDISDALSQLVSSRVAPVFVGVGVIVENEGRRHLHVPVVTRPDRQHAWLDDIDSGNSPMLRCVRDNQPLFYDDPAHLAGDFPHLAADVQMVGRRSLACIPLAGPVGPIGILFFWWERPHPTDAAERGIMFALAGYTSQAVQRVALLQERIDAAHTLQRAMLTELPDPADLQLAARYYPAHAGDQVGGDWYDAFITPTGATTLVIGDIAGHDITAASKMGQFRSMLRALAVDRDGPPDDVLSRLDQAMFTLDLDAFASAIVARIEPASGSAGPSMTRKLTWSNAGHPPPLVMLPDGRVDILAGVKPLLGLRADFERTTDALLLPAESTLLLYTDGLIEKRGEDIHDSIAKLRDLLGHIHRLPLDDMLDAMIDTSAGHDHEDDIAILACRLRAPSKPASKPSPGPMPG